MTQGRLPERLRLGPVELDRYLAGQLHGLAYMRRLRAIEDEEQRHLRELGEAWAQLAAEAPDDDAFAHAWSEVAEGWSFRRLNELISKHNAYYPIEARVPMNPHTGTYARGWRRAPYDASWILERFPAVRDMARDQVPRRGAGPAPVT